MELRNNIVLNTLYENYTCLWDVKSEDYHNKVQRNSAINEIAKHIGTTGQSTIILS